MISHFHSKNHIMIDWRYLRIKSNIYIFSYVFRTGILLAVNSNFTRHIDTCTHFKHTLTQIIKEKHLHKHTHTIPKIFINVKFVAITIFSLSILMNKRKFVGIAYGHTHLYASIQIIDWLIRFGTNLQYIEMKKMSSQILKIYFCILS